MKINREFRYGPRDRQWDQFQAFHNCWNNFVQFENGALLIRGGAQLRPHLRRKFNEYHIGLFLVTDIELSGYKLFTTDGTPVPKAWVQRKGNYVMLFDYDTNRAYSRIPSNKSHALGVPANIQHWGSLFYYPGPAAEPIHGRTVLTSPRKRSSEEAKLDKELVTYCRVAHELNPMFTHWAAGDRVQSTIEAVRSGVPVYEAVEDNVHVISYIANYGLPTMYETSEVDYLTFKEV